MPIVFPVDVQDSRISRERPGRGTEKTRTVMLGAVKDLLVYSMGNQCADTSGRIGTLVSHTINQLLADLQQYMHFKVERER